MVAAATRHWEPRSRAETRVQLNIVEQPGSNAGLFLTIELFTTMRQRTSYMPVETIWG